MSGSSSSISKSLQFSVTGTALFSPGPCGPFGPKLPGSTVIVLPPNAPSSPLIVAFIP